MAIINAYTAKFTECDSLLWQDLSTQNGSDYTGYERELVITFPDASVLTITESIFPTADSLSNIFGAFYSVVQPFFATWGIDDTRNAIMFDTDYLKTFVGTNTTAYKDSDGEDLAFDYDNFPSGVYTISYYFNNDATPEDNPGDPEPTEWTTIVRMYNDCEIEACMATAFEDLQSADCEGDACEKLRELKDTLIKVTIMLAAASMDFTNARYAESNNKLRAADVLCSTGVCSYHHGC